MSNFDITKLNKSSFRGVPFYTQATELSSGHRLTDHTFINGGTKTEDNGLQNKTFKITGYLGGANYLTEKQNLINALDELGTGTLIDKFYGSIQVQVDSYTTKEEKTKFGQVILEITFKKEENKLQQKTLSTYNQDITSQVLSSFEIEYNPALGEEIMNQVALGITTVLNKINDTIKFLEEKRDFANEVKATIGKAISTIKSDVLQVKDLSNEIVNIVTTFNKVLDFEKFQAKDQKSLTSNLSETLQNTINNTPNNQVEVIAAKQVKIYTIAICTLLMQTSIKNLENVTFSTGDDMGNVKHDILTMFDNLKSEIVSNVEDNIIKIESRKNLLDAYHTSKKEFVKFYTQKYSGLQNLRDVEVVATIDLLTLTMDKYDDIERVDEVLDNNDIIDPIFINGNLKLLVR